MEAAQMPGYELTDRQAQVVALINRGLTNTEIADEMGISTRTVKAHTETIRTRYGIDLRRHIVPVLRERGVIE